MDYQLLELFRSSGLRNTHARQRVFKVLKANPAISIQKLYQQVGNAMDRASMYRTLNLFREMGIVHDVVIAGQRKLELTDRFSDHHHHIACIACGKTVAIHDSNFETHIETLALANGFVHQSHSFEITGICKDCRQAGGVARV